MLLSLTMLFAALQEERELLEKIKPAIIQSILMFCGKVLTVFSLHSI